MCYPCSCDAGVASSKHTIIRGRRRRRRSYRMPIKTKRWNDPAEPDDGFRLLVTRYRPRGVSKAAETWDEWWPELGPSRALHAAYWGKTGKPLTFEAYVPRYLEEMQQQTFRIRAL